MGQQSRPLKVLFLHQNFPGQFKHLAPALAAAGHEVHALLLSNKPGVQWQGVKVHTYFPHRSSTHGLHPWLIDVEAKVIRGEAVLHWATQIKQQGAKLK